MKKFGLPATASDGSKTKDVDYVRKKGLTQNTYGVVWNVNYTNAKWDVIGGLSLQNFEANHYGYLTYTSNDQLRADLFTDKGRYMYYDSDASKTDDQIFLKGMYHITKSWDVFADVQYRHVNFLTNGNNDKFIKQADGSYAPHRLNLSKNYDFLNPKVGFSYHKDGHSAYLSYALSHREPERNNFTDNGSYPAPKAESLHDVELGYNYQGSCWHAGIGLYSMYYHNQFVQTGLVTEIGENLTTNIKRSYRLGLELTAGVDVTKWFSLEANAAISKNTIRDFDEVVETYDDNWGDLDPTIVHYDNSTLAFSPTAILNGFADFHIKGFEAPAIKWMQKQKNGYSYRLSHVIMPPVESVYSVLKGTVIEGDTVFSEFLDVCTGFEATDLLTWAGISAEINTATGSSPQDAYTVFTRNYKLGSKSISNACLDMNVKMFNTYNYTLFAPDNSAMQKAYANGLPRWDDIVALFEKYPQDEEHDISDAEQADMKRAKKMISQIRDFVRYHFVTSSVYADNTIEGGRYQTLSSDAMGVAKEVTISGGSGQLTVSDQKAGHTVTVNASDSRKLSNKMARDYWLNASKTQATGIETSSFCAVHQISEPLCINSSGKYNE